MTQYARPASDISNSGWTNSTGSTLFGCVDEESASDTDYISAYGTETTCELALSAITTPSLDSGHAIYVRAKGSSAIGCRLSASLYQASTLIATLFSNQVQSSSFAENSAVLSESQAASITDYSDLRIRFTGNASGKTVYISHVYMAAPDGSSAQNLTLTCEAGSYALTGTNADLTVTRHYTLTCEAGSYSLTGTNAALTSARTLICESASGAYPDIIVSGAGTTAANGTYIFYDYFDNKPYYKCNETGSWLIWGFNDSSWEINNDFIDTLYCSYDDVATPDLVTTWTAYGLYGVDPVPTVTVATTYALTGSDVTLTYTQGAQSYTLTCEAGSYSLTGTNADLTVQRNYTLACEAGLFNLTGTDVSFAVQRNYSLECEAGSYSLTGSDVTLDPTFHYSLACEAGTFTLTGTDITFGNTTAYSLTCASGSYTLTGSDISFVIQRNYSLACNAGSYSLTGTDADLVLLRNYILACGVGTYTLTGTSASLTSARSLACNSGAYVLTGLEADLFKGLVMPCASGSYALTGTDASLTSHRIFALGMGSYVLVGTNAGLFILSPTPACRTAIIEYENRIFAIPHENRTATIEYENRTFAIPHENRTATIEFENRTLEVKCH